MEEVSETDIVLASIKNSSVFGIVAVPWPIYNPALKFIEVEVVESFGAIFI